ncbi:hypothetical protein [Streptomyces laurentii]|uniref:hypothetical protein n=1 Tax=Streptomyces laurentii TaxID=39478 RepID=UPI0036790AB5
MAARTILKHQQFEDAVEAACAALPGIGYEDMADGVSAALAVVGLLAPPPELDGDTCTALYADPSGQWWQCEDDPGHDGRHDAGEHTWTDADDDAYPAQQ